MWRAVRPAIRIRAPELQGRRECSLTGDLSNQPLRSSSEYDSNSRVYTTFWSSWEFTHSAVSRNKVTNLCSSGLCKFQATTDYRKFTLVNPMEKEKVMSTNRKLYLYEALELRAEYETFNLMRRVQISQGPPITGSSIAGQGKKHRRRI